MKLFSGGFWNKKCFTEIIFTVIFSKILSQNPFFSQRCESIIVHSLWPVCRSLVQTVSSPHDIHFVAVSIKGEFSCWPQHEKSSLKWPIFCVPFPKDSADYFLTLFPLISTVYNILIESAVWTFLGLFLACKSHFWAKKREKRNEILDIVFLYSCIAL